MFNDPDTFYAHVEPYVTHWESGDGYDLVLFLTPEGLRCANSCTDKRLTAGQLFMRLATSDEKKQIWQALQDKRARHGYCFDRDRNTKTIQAALFRLIVLKIKET